MSTFLDIIQRRAATRAFLDRPVTNALIEKILECARWSPSGANLQPWQVVIVRGKTKLQLSDAIVSAYDDGVKPHPEQPYYPQNWFEPYKRRRFETGVALYNSLGIQRKDRARREQQWKANYHFFGAPVGMIVLVDKRLGKGVLVDMGAFIQSVMLAATALGLASCPQAALGDYPDVVREALDLNENLMIVCGIAIGYADEENPVNQYRTERESVEAFTRWYD